MYDCCVSNDAHATSRLQGPRRSLRRGPTGPATLAVLAAIACGAPSGDRGGVARPPGDAAAITGFTRADAARERAAERQLLSGASADRVSAFHRTLTAEPHRATSPRNTELARWIADTWRAQGWEDVVVRTFPDGPWGPDSHVQRGMTGYMSIVPGDPTTPGWPALPGARHLAPAETGVLPRIMALAISARDARPLLEHMTGSPVPRAWAGGLPITYRFTGGVTAHLRVKMASGLHDYVNVEARIRGSEHPEQWVAIGNHRDAWVYGGADPSSGTASMLELTRGLGALRRGGWRPLRTIVACSWDGEEEGLVGSTEWAEQYAGELERNLVAYLNVDTSIFGVRSLLTGATDPNFEVVAVPSLSRLIIEASHDVPAPNGPSLYAAWRRTRGLELAAEQAAAGGAPAAGPGSAPGAAGDADLVIEAVEASSDHAAFLQHLGRPVLAMTYSGQYGVYHSIYDDRYYMEHFGDPGFAYSVNMAQIWGVLAMRLANAQVLPLDFVPYAELIGQAFTELAEAAGGKLDFAEATARLAAFRAAAEAARQAAARLVASPAPDTAAVARLNAAAMAVESNWTSEHVVPGRPWSRHLIYGMRLSLQSQVMPGLTDAIIRQDWPAGREQLAQLAAALERNASALRAAAGP